MDEPTNHLDIDATLWLEQWLKGYPGTLVLVSHDRDFLDNVVDRILVFEDQAGIQEYVGVYSDWAKRGKHLKISILLGLMSKFKIPQVKKISYQKILRRL